LAAYGPSWELDYPLLITEYPDAPPTLSDALDYLSSFVTRINATGVIGQPDSN